MRHSLLPIVHGVLHVSLDLRSEISSIIIVNDANSIFKM